MLSHVPNPRCTNILWPSSKIKLCYCRIFIGAQRVSIHYQYAPIQAQRLHIQTQLHAVASSLNPYRQLQQNPWTAYTQRAWSMISAKFALRLRDKKHIGVVLSALPWAVLVFYKVRWRLRRPLEAPRLISSPANPELPFLATPMLPDVYGSSILLKFKIC